MICEKVDVGKLVKVEGCSLAHDHYDDQDQEQMAGPQGGLCEAARAGDLGLVNRLLEQGEQINQVFLFIII